MMPMGPGPRFSPARMCRVVGLCPWRLQRGSALEFLHLRAVLTAIFSPSYNQGIFSLGIL